MAKDAWILQEGEGPVVATAIHNGHDLRVEVAELMALAEPDRLREEDPFTAEIAAVVPTLVTVLRSRFEVDLNRPRHSAVYRVPDDCWGLEVWRSGIPETVVDGSLAIYDAFYGLLGEVLGAAEEAHGGFVLLDVHSYNHRRGGPDAPPDHPEANPEVNVGTGTMDRRWSGLVNRFMEDLREFEVEGRHLDVRENVRFRGGHLARWVHEQFPESGCALAIEFKKVFMDEWTGKPDAAVVVGLRDALAGTVPGMVEELGRG